MTDIAPSIANVSSAYCESIYNTAVGLGADGSALLSILGADENSFANPARRFSCHAILDMLALAEQQTENRAIGLASGINFTPATFGDVGYAAISSSTLREAGEINARYAKLNQQFGETKFEVVDDIARSNWHPFIEDAERMRPITEAVFTGLVNIGRWLLWSYNEQAQLVRFRHKKPSEPDPCAAYFGCKVEYEQDIDSLEYAGHTADAKLPQSNPPVLTMLKVRLDHSIQNLEMQETTASQAHQCIQHLISNELPTATKIASMMGIGDKTLFRRLKQDGTSFRQLLKTVQIENFDVLRSEGDKNLAEIAQALGYSDQSAFSRAYKSWFGHPPSLKDAGV